MKKVPLILSVPAGELARCELPATVFPVEHLLAGSISLPLRHALGTLQQTLAKKYSALWCVARPEMFVEATTSAWLKERMGGARDHICLTDGHAVKAIPGLRNRLFFYAGEWASSVTNFRRCLLRAPEQLLQFAGTINDPGASFAELPEQTLEAEVLRASVHAETPRLGWAFPFYSNPHSHEDSANRMLARGNHANPVDEASRVAAFELFICTEASLQDLNFCRVLAEKINDAAFGASRRLVILLPELESSRNGNVERMLVLLAGLARSGIAVPRAYLKDIHLVADLGVLNLLQAGAKKGQGGYHLTIPQSLAGWRYARALFSQAKSITCHLDETKQKTVAPMTGNLQKMIGCPIKFAGWSAEARRAENRRG